jgi:cytochrome c oxidase cbb3-type subunit 2
MKLDFGRNHWLLFGVSFFGFIGLAFLVGIGPAIWVQNHTEPLPGSAPPTHLETEGLKVYVSEGCVYCHTQQVRPLEMDNVWGRPSAPGDYAYVRPTGFFHPYAPAVLGSERTGPDLSNVGARQASDVWQYMHLYNPRSVVEGSVMPAFPWLFDVKAEAAEGETVVPVPVAFAPAHGVVVPNARGRALVAYLLARRQVPIEGYGGATPKAASATASSPGGADGSAAYAMHCASCHQTTGQGLPGAFPSLANDPVVTDADPAAHIDTILHGKQGVPIGGVSYASPMPPFADQLDDATIAAIVNHERTSWGNAAPAVTAEDVAARRQAGGAK